MFGLGKKPAVINGWICSSHPEIIWDALGNCPRCGLELEPGTLPVAETRPAPQSARRWFLKTGLAFLSGLIWLAFPLRHLGYGEDVGPRGGMGMMGGGGMMGVRVPKTLSTPKSHEWLSNLGEVLSLERLSLVQYQTDEDKFHVYRPYMMIIHQEENHIQWITELFTAYGLSAAGPTPAIKRSQTISQAYEIARGLEADLIPRYQGLITNAEDSDTRQVLNPILQQTRMHYRMFSMALHMGGMMGPGMMEF